MQALTRTLTGCSLAAACLLTIASVGAAAPQPGADKNAQPTARPRIDANADGQISRAEYQAWIDARFAKLDSNGDGIVTAEEIANSPAVRARNERRAQRLIERFGGEGANQVSKAQFEAGQMSRFERLSDGKDTVDVAQLKARHAGKGYRHGPRDEAADGNR